MIGAISMIKEKTGKRVLVFIDDAQEIFHYDSDQVRSFLYGLVNLKEVGVASILLVFSESSQVYKVNHSMREND